MTGSSEGHRFNEISFGRWGHRASPSPSSSSSTSGLGNGRPSAAGADKVRRRRPIGPLRTLTPAHAVSDVESLERLSEGATDALHAGHVGGLRARAVKCRLDVDDVSLQEVHHCEPIHTSDCDSADILEPNMEISNNNRLHTYVHRLVHAAVDSSFT